MQACKQKRACRHGALYPATIGNHVTQSFQKLHMKGYGLCPCFLFWGCLPVHHFCEAESLHLISNLNVFTASSYSFILMPILASSLNGSFTSLLFYSLLLFASIKTDLKLIFLNPGHFCFKCYSTVTFNAGICNQIGSVTDFS